MSVYFLTDQPESNGDLLKIEETAFRKDSKAEATDIKFSPSNTMIAAGFRDDCIYLYSCQMSITETGKGRNIFQTGNCVLRALHKLRGHSSTITHIGKFTLSENCSLRLFLFLLTSTNNTFAANND